MGDLFMDQDYAKFQRRRRLHCLRQDREVFGLTEHEEAEAEHLSLEFGPDLSREQPEAPDHD